MLKSALQIPVTFDESGVLLPDMPDFDLAQTLDCGQAFRWEEQMDGSFIGIAGLGEFRRFSTTFSTVC